MTIIIEDGFHERYDKKIDIFYDDKKTLNHYHQESPILTIPGGGLMTTVTANCKWPLLMAIWYDNSCLEIEAVEGSIGPYESIWEKMGREISPSASTGRIKLKLSAVNIPHGPLNDPDTTVTVGDAPPEA